MNDILIRRNTRCIIFPPFRHICVWRPTHCELTHDKKDSFVIVHEFIETSSLFLLHCTFKIQYVECPRYKSYGCVNFSPFIYCLNLNISLFNISKLFWGITTILFNREHLKHLPFWNNLT